MENQETATTVARPLVPDWRALALIRPAMAASHHASAAVAAAASASVAAAGLSKQLRPLPIAFKPAPSLRTIVNTGHWKATGQNFGNPINSNQMTSEFVPAEISAC